MYKLSILFAAFALSSVAPAQWINYPTPGIPRTPDGKPDLTAPTPKSADGRPDLSGIWRTEPTLGVQPNGLGCEPVSREFVNIGASLKDGLPYQSWAADLVKVRRADPRMRPITNGRPLGLVAMHAFPAFRKVAQLPGLLILLVEYNSSFRQIFTDGRPLPVDPNPTWDGYSAGKWNGDTLVVETNGFRDDTWLDITGNPLTESGKITEKFRRVNFGTLEIELTVDDPKAYTKPWTVKLKQLLVIDTELLPAYLENEKDIQHMVVK